MNSKLFLSVSSLEPAQRWALFGLFAVAVGSLWLSRLLEQGDKPAPVPVDARLPDYTISDYAATLLDQAGRIAYQLQALETRAYPQAATELTEPYVVFYIDGQPGWYARAQAGEVSADRQTVRLLGETRVWRYNALGQWEGTIETRDVTLKLDSRYAETSAPALITAPGGAMQGIGLKAYLPEQRVELLAQVKGHYEKP